MKEPKFDVYVPDKYDCIGALIALLGYLYYLLRTQEHTIANNHQNISPIFTSDMIRPV
jgi:hypothetical protein